MSKINVNYIDTRKYIVNIETDLYNGDGPDTWGNFTIVQFRDNDFNAFEDIDDYLTESGRLLPKYQAMLRSGKMFTIDYRRYSNSDGGFYKLDGAYDFKGQTIDSSIINGFIIFEDEYIKGVDYEERKRYAKSDLELYTRWANGEVYQVNISTDTGLEVDSLGGLYGRDGVDDYIKDTIPFALPQNIEEIYS